MEVEALHLYQRSQRHSQTKEQQAVGLSQEDEGEGELQQVCHDHGQQLEGVGCRLVAVEEVE